MSRYLGFVTIMVNVASEWGLTKREYTQLQELYNKYQKDGLRIVAFPSNEFGNQEPGDNSVIEDFVTQKFGVTFDMMAKTTVNGDNPEPVIAWAKSHPNGSGFLFNTIKWVRFIISDPFFAKVNHFYAIFSSKIFRISPNFWLTEMDKLLIVMLHRQLPDHLKMIF